MNDLFPPAVDKPLFIALRTEWYEAFRSGKKTVEYRRYGPSWNEKTCPPGRPVILSKGYSKHSRMTGRITKFQRKVMDTEIYGRGVLIACIHIELERK